MLHFLRSKYGILLTIVTILIFTVMVISAADRSKVTFFEDITVTIFSPVQKVFFNAGKGIGNFFKFIGEIKTLQEQNKKLLTEIEIITEQNRNLQKLGEENSRFKEMLNLKEELDNFDMIGAQVIAKQSGNWFEIFTIDKGTSDGIEKNCAVITSQGLVGHIFEISSHSAKIISIIDGNSAVSGLITRTRDFGMVKGDLVFQEDGLCKMIYINKDADIVIGDMVETSGLGGIYPKGLFIGKIKEVKKESHQVSKFALIEPIVDFKSLEYVFVIKR